MGSFIRRRAGTYEAASTTYVVLSTRYQCIWKQTLCNPAMPHYCQYCYKHNIVILHHCDCILHGMKMVTENEYHAVSCMYVNISASEYCIAADLRICLPYCTAASTMVRLHALRSAARVCSASRSAADGSLKPTVDIIISAASTDNAVRWRPSLHYFAVMIVAIYGQLCWRAPPLKRRHWCWTSLSMLYWFLWRTAIESPV